MNPTHTPSDSETTAKTEPAPGDEVPKLTDLNMTVLDAAGLEALLRDIELCTQVSEVIPKHASRGHVPEAGKLTLGDARELLRDRAVRAVQIRYRYQEADWWDTLMVVDQGYRLVRIRHEFGGMD